MTDAPASRDLRDTREPVCPYCGHRHRDAWEWRLSDGDSDTHDCEHCEKPFKVECRITRTFTTEKA